MNFLPGLNMHRLFTYLSVHKWDWDGIVAQQPSILGSVNRQFLQEELDAVFAGGQTLLVCFQY